MPIEIDGASLTRERLVRVARDGERVELSATARERMRRSRAVAESAFARGERVYGLTTGYGAQKRAAVDPRAVSEFNRRQLHDHAVGQGPPAAADLIRATMLVLANQFAGGSTCVRPLLAELLIEALNDGWTPSVRTLGSIGMSDLAPMADLAEALVGEIPLEAGEGLALINTSAFGTAAAALALHDADLLLDTADVAAALALEGFAANLSILHPAVEQVRPHAGLAESAARFRDLLDGSYLWDPSAARSLQDPLTFRSTVGVQAAARGVLAHASRVLAIELNSAQGNPLVVPDEERIISAAAYETLPLAAALDYARIGLASALTSASERAVKLLDTPWSGLPTGLSAGAAGSPDLGLSIHAISAQALATEAALLAQPVSFALASTAGAEGVEDRATMLPLAARRLAEMLGLGYGVLAVELLVAAQAVELRGAAPAGRDDTGETSGTAAPGRRETAAPPAAAPLGCGTAAALRLIRTTAPFAGPGEPIPADVGPLVDLVASGAFAAAICGRD